MTVNWKTRNGDLSGHLGPTDPISVVLLSLMPVRHSGLQKDVLALYRRYVLSRLWTFAMVW